MTKLCLYEKKYNLYLVILIKYVILFVLKIFQIKF